MKYLLDTNILIDHLRKKTAVDLDILDAGAALTVISLAELYYGAHRSNNTESNLEEINRTIIKLNLKVIELDTQAVSLFGEIKCSLEKSGEKIEDFDLLIASTALALDLTLVTNNKKHFSRIKDLKIYDF